MWTSMGNILQNCIKFSCSVCVRKDGMRWGRDRERRDRLYVMSINKIQLLSFSVRSKVLSSLPIFQYLLVFHGFLVVILAWWPYLLLCLMLESISARHFWNWLVCFRIILAIFFWFVQFLNSWSWYAMIPNKSRNKTLLIL